MQAYVSVFLDDRFLLGGFLLQGPSSSLSMVIEHTGATFLFFGLLTAKGTSVRPFASQIAQRGRRSGGYGEWNQTFGETCTTRDAGTP